MKSKVLVIFCHPGFSFLVEHLAGIVHAVLVEVVLEVAVIVLLLEEELNQQ